MHVNVSQQMKQILGTYSDKIMKEVGEILFEVGQEAADELHSAGGFRGRKYRHNWTTDRESQRTFDSVTVYNKKHYRLTHLLEFGHATANGGRTRDFPHIAPANEEAIKKAEKRIEAMIRQIS